MSKVTIDDLAALRTASSPRISPNGRYLAYVEKRVGLDRNRYYQNLVLVDLAKGRDQRLTSGDHSDSQPAWMPDSKSLVFVSDREKEKNLFQIDVSGGEPRQLTKHDGLLSNPQISPDGRFVAYLHAPKNRTQKALASGKEHPGPQFRHITRLSYKLDGHGFWNDAYLQIYLLDLKSGNTKALTRGKFHNGQQAWSPDGKLLAFVANRNRDADIDIAHNDIYVISPRGGRPRLVTRRKGLKFAPSWSPDGRQIAFVGHFAYPEWVENHHVFTIPRQGGAARDLLPDTDIACSNEAISDTKDVAEGEAPLPLWSKDGKSIRFLASQEGAVNIFEVSSKGGAPKALSRGKHEIAEFTQSTDGKTLAFLHIDATYPGDIYTASWKAPGAKRGLVPGAKVERRSRVNRKALSGKSVQEPEEYRIRTRGGHDVHGWVLYAKGKKQKAPAILMVHGGPYAMYAWSYFHEFQTLAAAGYHVYFTNIRGSVGYGRDYMRAIIGRWGADDYDDVMDVADFIESRPFVDTDRMAIAGGSYGGFMTNWVIGRTRRFKCAITMRSLSNMLSFYGASDIGWDFYEEYKAHPWENYERFWRSSPLAFVKAIRTPLLIIHSDEDHRCPIGQAEELFTALKLEERDVEMLVFVGESHGLSRSGRPHNRLERLRRIVDWFERKL